jgi:hypothetical protein
MVIKAFFFSFFNNKSLLIFFNWGLRRPLNRPKVQTGRELYDTRYDIFTTFYTIATTFFKIKHWICNIYIYDSHVIKHIKLLGLVWFAE